VNELQDNCFQGSAKNNKSSKKSNPFQGAMLKETMLTELEG